MRDLHTDPRQTEPWHDPVEHEAGNDDSRAEQDDTAPEGLRISVCCSLSSSSIVVGSGPS